MGTLDQCNVYQNDNHLKSCAVLCRPLLSPAVLCGVCCGPLWSFVVLCGI